MTMIVLAAGSSSRFVRGNKLLQPLGGKTVIERTVSAVLDAGRLLGAGAESGASIDEVIVVTGTDRERVESTLAGYTVRLRFNERHREGMGSSIRSGAEAAGRGCIGIFPGDMPYVKAETIAMLVGTLSQHPESIVVPRFDGLRGHPVVFAERFYDELLSLTGDEGARSILKRHAPAVVEVEVEDPGVLRDIDTPQDYEPSGKTLGTS